VTLSFAEATDLPSGQDQAARQVDALARATDLIRAALGGQQVTRVDDDTVILEGNGRRVLQLPQIPVIAVGSVAVNGTTRAVGTDFTVTRDGRLTALGYPWPVGAQVTVTYSHGYDLVPEDLARLCAALADKILAGTIGVRSMQESIGTKQSSVTYAATGSNSVFDDSEQAILDKYRLHPLP
jgi:hypothetical protein